MSQADASCAGTRAVPTDLHAASVARALSNVAAHPEAARLALLARRDHAALAEARARDALLCAGVAPPPLAGETLGVKACFDVAGWVTHAGSRVLAGEPPALRDAAIVQALRHAGATLLAQNNMTEFAYGALGLNCWHGTPLTPLMADAPRVAEAPAAAARWPWRWHGDAGAGVGHQRLGPHPGGLLRRGGFQAQPWTLSRCRHGLSVAQLRRAGHPGAGCRRTACAWIARWCMNLKTMAWRARHRTGTRRA